MKAFWKSKTLWFNVLSIAAMAGGAPGAIGLDPNVAGVIVGASNIGLRLLTKTAVSVREPAPAAGQPAGV